KTMEEFSQNNSKLLRDLQLRFEKAWGQISYTSGQRVVPAHTIAASNPAARYQEMVSKHLELVYKHHSWSSSFAQSNAELQTAIASILACATIDKELNIAELDFNNIISQLGNEMNHTYIVKSFEKAPNGWKYISTLHLVFNIIRKRHRALYYLNDEM